MPYVNHIAYTSKSVNVSLFDFSQQLLQILKFRYWKRCEMCVWRLPTKFETKKNIPHHLCSSSVPHPKTSFGIKNEGGEEHILKPIQTIILGGYMNCEHIREFCGSCFDLITYFKTQQLGISQEFTNKCGSKANLQRLPSLRVKVIDNQMRIFDDRPILLCLFLF